MQNRDQRQTTAPEATPASNARVDDKMADPVAEPVDDPVAEKVDDPVDDPVAKKGAKKVAAPAVPSLKFVEVQVMRKCAPTYLRTQNPDGTVYDGEPTPFDEDGNPVMQLGEIKRTVPPETVFLMEAKEAAYMMRNGAVLPTYNSFS